MHMMRYLYSARSDFRAVVLGRYAWITIIFVFVILATTSCYNSTTGDTSVYGIAEFKLPVIPKTGSHKVMVFSEMHYQRSFRSQDVPRLLPSPDSVLFGGLGGPEGVIEKDAILKEIVPESLSHYRELKIPSRVKQSYDAERTAEIYRVNCSVCHGLSMQGDGPVAGFMRDKGLAPVPADLMSELTSDALDGEIFAFISRGGRQGYALIEKGRESRSPMPEFLLLLSEDDRWSLVKYLKDFAQ